MMEEELARVKKEVSSLAMVANGITLQSLFKDYTSIVGPFNYRAFGYSDPLSFLKSMTDVIRPLNRYDPKTREALYEPVSNPNTDHILGMIKKQKNAIKIEPSRSKYSNKHMSTTFKKKANPIPSKVGLNFQTKERVIKMFKNMPDGIWFSKVATYYFEEYKQKLEISVDDLLYYMPELYKFKANNVFTVALKESNKRISSSSNSSDSSKASSEMANLTLMQSLSEVFDKNPEGIYASDFIKKFESIKNYSLNPREFGYNSIMDMAHNLPLVFFISNVQGYNGDRLLLDARCSNNMNKVLSQLEINEMKSKIQDNIIKLFNQQTSIPLEMIETTYFNTYKIPIPWIRLKYTSLLEMMMEFENYDFLKIEKGLHERDVLITLKYVKKKEESKPFDAYLTLEYSNQKLASTMDSAIYHPVYVSCVYSPDFFYIQLEEFLKPLISLMNILRDVYDTPGVVNKYRIPPEDIEINLVCAYKCPKRNWLRARVIGISPEFTLQYIDYGNMKTVKPNEVFYMKKEFMGLPAQAIKSKCFGIKPHSSDGSWPAYAVSYLIEVTRDTLLTALFKDNENGKVRIDLCNINGDQDIFISDKLVERNFAQVDTELREQKVEKSCDLQDGFRIDTSIEEEAVLSEDITIRYIKRIELKKGYYPFHFIALDSELYMSAKEISSMFYKNTHINTILISKNITLPSIFVTERTKPSLFTQMRIYKVPDSLDTNMIQLYPLKSVAFILASQGHPHCKELIMKILFELLNYDPEEPVWWDFAAEDEVEDLVFTKPTNQPTNDLTLVEINMSLKGLKNDKDAIIGDNFNLSLINGKINELEKRKAEIENNCKEMTKRILKLFNVE